MGHSDYLTSCQLTSNQFFLAMQRQLPITLPSGRKARVQAMEAEDGSGLSWNITLVVIGSTVLAPFTVHVRCVA